MIPQNDEPKSLVSFIFHSIFVMTGRVRPPLMAMPLTAQQSHQCHRRTDYTPFCPTRARNC